MLNFSYHITFDLMIMNVNGADFDTPLIHRPPVHLEGPVNPTKISLASAADITLVSLQEEKAAFVP